MNNDIFKDLALAMNKIEKDSTGCIFAINPDIEVKAHRLLSDFVSNDITARLDYNPAYSQITVIADTFVFDITKQHTKNNLLCADVICIDSTSDGQLHIECVFNDAFRKVGVLNE